MKFTFISETVGFGSPSSKLEFECDQLSDVVVYFEQFLRGAGYVFDGNLNLNNITETQNDFISPGDDYVPDYSTGCSPFSPHFDDTITIGDISLNNFEYGAAQPAIETFAFTGGSDTISFDLSEESKCPCKGGCKK